jgi:hypothetical protein
MENAQTQPRRRSALSITTTIAQLLIRICGPTALVLGVLFWTGNALTLLPLHMLAGIVLVLALWTLAIVAAVSGVQRGLVALAIVWGLIVPILGMSQNQLLPSALHWVIRVLHLLIGIVAMGLGNGLASRIKQVQTPTRGIAPRSRRSTTSGSSTASSATKSPLREAARNASTTALAGKIGVGRRRAFAYPAASTARELACRHRGACRHRSDG